MGFQKLGLKTSLPPFFPPLLFSYPSPAPFSQTSASLSFSSLSPPAIHIFFALSFPLSLSQTRLRWGLSCSENDGNFTQAPALLTDPAVGLRHRRLGSLNRVGVLCSLSIWCSCRFSCVYVNLVFIAFGNALTEWVWDEF
jgi:hypothetical protein